MARIDYEKLRRVKPSLGIGGTVQTFAIDGAELIFVTDDGDRVAARFESIFVMKHGRGDGAVMRIPSILGRDFLNRYSLVYSYKTGGVKITDEEAAAGEAV